MEDGMRSILNNLIEVVIKDTTRLFVTKQIDEELFRDRLISARASAEEQLIRLFQNIKDGTK